MEIPKGVPLRNQGEPLPPDFPYKGQWIHKPRMFLYHPKVQHSLGAPEMTPVVDVDKPDWSFGINAKNLAWDLQVSIEEIFAHNSVRTLFLVTAFDVGPTFGATHAKRYVFQIGNRQTTITIEGGGPSGRA